MSNYDFPKYKDSPVAELEYFYRVHTLLVRIPKHRSWNRIVSLEFFRDSYMILSQQMSLYTILLIRFVCLFQSQSTLLHLYYLLEC
jgi:hypothetical protein